MNSEYKSLKDSIEFYSELMSEQALRHGVSSEDAKIASKQFVDLCNRIQVIVSNDKSLRKDFRSFRKKVLTESNQAWAKAIDPYTLRHHQITSALFPNKHRFMGSDIQNNQKIIPYIEILRESGCLWPEEKIRKKLNK